MSKYNFQLAGCLRIAANVMQLKNRAGNYPQNLMK